MSPTLNQKPTSPSVLVADDDVLIQRWIVALLRQLGCSGMVVGDGQQALSCLRERSFALVLLDVSMPVLDGLATLAQLRRREAQDGRGARQTVVMVTAHAEPGDVARLHAAGADGYVAKPLIPTLFNREIRRCLARAGAIDPLQESETPA